MLNIKLLLPLIAANKRPIFELYFEYWQLGWNHFLQKNLSSAVKQEQIKLLERAIRKDFPLKQNLLSKLQQAFIAENLSLYLLLDLLPAWRYLATETAITTESQLSDIIGYAASPLARIIMALNNEVPSTYLPMQSLLCALIWHHLLKHKSPLLHKIRLSESKKKSKLTGLIKNARVLLAIIKSKKLKFRIAILLNRTALIIQKNKQAEFDLLDDLKIFLYSIWQFLTVRKRTLTQKGL